MSEAERLRALGIVREDGTVDYSLILEALGLASRDEYLGQAILQFVVRNFREDVRRMLGVSFGGVKLVWNFAGSPKTAGGADGGPALGAR